MKRHFAPPGTRVVASALAPLPFTLLCVTVLCVLAAHAAHLPAWYTAALAMILAARWWQRRRQPRRVDAWLRIGMLIAVLATAIAVYGTPLGREPGAAIVCGLLVLKVLEIRIRGTSVQPRVSVGMVTRARSLPGRSGQGCSRSSTAMVRPGRWRPSSAKASCSGRRASQNPCSACSERRVRSCNSRQVSSILPASAAPSMQVSSSAALFW
jgi:hypothetical protein